MLKRLIWILCFCLPLLSVGAQGLKRADAAQSKAMIERINKTASGIRSIDCQFTQVKTLRFLDDVADCVGSTSDLIVIRSC